jgi:hypothetical protein
MRRPAHGSPKGSRRCVTPCAMWRPNPPSVQRQAGQRPAHELRAPTPLSDSPMAVERLDHRAVRLHRPRPRAETVRSLASARPSEPHPCPSSAIRLDRPAHAPMPVSALMVSLPNHAHGRRAPSGSIALGSAPSPGQNPHGEPAEPRGRAADGLGRIGRTTGEPDRCDGRGRAAGGRGRMVEGMGGPDGAGRPWASRRPPTAGDVRLPWARR